MVYEREQVILRVSNGFLFADAKATLNQIEAGNKIHFCETMDARQFWTNYRWAKVYNPSFGRKALLQSAFMSTANYPRGFALDGFTLDFDGDAIKVDYTVTIQ